MPVKIEELPRAAPVTAIGGRRTVVAGSLLAATALYFLAELAVARRWARPYDWSGNMISDLGVPECLGDLSRAGGLAVADRYVCSPWHSVMNTMFVLIGVLGVGAAIVLAPLFPRPWRRITLALATINGLALACVGLFPGSAGEFPDGPRARIVVHPIAAYVEHVSGLALMAVAFLLLVRTRPALAAATAVLIAVSGIAALVIPWANPLGPGGTERAAIDPFLWWRCLLGLALLTSAVRRSRRTAVRSTGPTAPSCR